MDLADTSELISNNKKAAINIMMIRIHCDLRTILFRPGLRFFPNMCLAFNRGLFTKFKILKLV
jgi:hypothetical protein